MEFLIVEHGSEQYHSAVDLRDRILRKPLGLQFTPEQLASESTYKHLVGTIDDQICACCILVQSNDGWFQARQVAVDSNFQRQGFGKRLMEYCHQHILACGGEKIFCHARKTAQKFYEGLEYQTVGEYFEEVTLQHIRMEKRL